MIQVRLSAVRVDLQSSTPVLLLTETDGLGRTLPIFVGPPEATSIAIAAQGIEPPRPLTHDLMRDILVALGARLDRVVVTELSASTYFAELHLKYGKESQVISSRPSDAVAIALRMESPIFVSDELMDSEGIMIALELEDGEGDSPENAEELVGQFREFLEHIRPEDFGTS